MAVIRPYRDSDAAALAALTLAAIRETGLRAYSPEQVAAWSGRFSPERVLEWVARGSTILVAADDAGEAVAYTVLEPDGHLDMLYCDPAHTGKGLGLALLEAAEAVARQQGVTRLFTEASELARPVFARAGYAVRHRRDFTIPSGDSEIAIHNYAMEKHLA